ncbi:flagellar hook-associated protein 1 FlgK [Octadecabacter temperatus]|uniref:Flagellar hook-associated protein 1 n=1 Tax=Octadecabacter temperatus TaxID=1458307 RepID=A0A0K0YA22_9RHOB|nr:flagellar hook-associated protein FlgK [Octadecabacter temperatus]AKS47783.1 Flagellar hook-associated protein 1 [Octadecabacter temperatus]SIO38523.1 flagellar hook-associated protein 1 FlgK [Octadecabacter temperatus]
MSISSSLSNALTGMTAASRMAEVVSSNVANSLTEGYGRRSVNLSSAVIGGAGAGVQIGSVTRHVDSGIIADRRLASAGLGGYETLVSTMNRIQDVIGEVGSTDSISSRIVAVESALIDAGSDPSSNINLSALAEKLSDVATSLNTASNNIQSERVRADSSISDQVGRLNTALSQVEQLNKDITNAKNSGYDPSGLMDQRQLVIDEISEIVPVREIDRTGGQVALMTPSGETLLDGEAKVFGFIQNAVITPDMTLQSGGLSGITLDGQPIATDGIGKLAGGTLGATFQARDSELVTAQQGLDAVAADLISRFQDPNVDPTLAVGQAGILTDAGAVFSVTNTTGLSSRISLNASVDPTVGGATTKLRDGLNATTVGPSGNASLLQAISGALADPRSTSTDSIQQSAAGRASNFEGEMGSTRVEFESEVSFANARWSSLKEAESADGVDTDYEMQMLLRVEQAYAANARVIQTVETLMQRLLEI